MIFSTSPRIYPEYLSLIDPSHAGKIHTEPSLATQLTRRPGSPWCDKRPSALLRMQQVSTRSACSIAIPFASSAMCREAVNVVSSSPWATSSNSDSQQPRSSSTPEFQLSSSIINPSYTINWIVPIPRAVKLGRYY
jgi:hypothetical protein